MKIMPTLALAACSIGLFSVVSAVHAQSGWQLQSAANVPGSVYMIGTGSAPTSITLTTVTSTATASATGSQWSASNYNSAYQFSELVTYYWPGYGPTVPFHVSVTPTATASSSTTPFTFASSNSSASTQPGSVTATANASGGTVSGNNNPGPYPVALNPGGVFTASLTLNLSAQASGAVYVSSHTFNSASSATVSTGAPIVP